MKATIVSFLPWAIRENKPGVIPGEYVIAKSDGKTPQILVVEDAITNIYVPLTERPFPSPIPVDQLANAIVNDLIKGCLEIAPPEAKPGIFWVEGAHTAAEIMSKFPDKVKEEITAQSKWFMRLVTKADEIWAQYRQPRLITDLQRNAALFLGLNKEWAVQPEPVMVTKCVACGTLIDTLVILCKNCKTVQPGKEAEAKKLGIGIVPIGA